jgi:hypothetical protein
MAFGLSGHGIATVARVSASAAVSASRGSAPGCSASAASPGATSTGSAGSCATVATLVMPALRRSTRRRAAGRRSTSRIATSSGATGRATSIGSATSADSALVGFYRDVGCGIPRGNRSNCGIPTSVVTALGGTTGGVATIPARTTIRGAAAAGRSTTAAIGCVSCGRCATRRDRKARNWAVTERLAQCSSLFFIENAGFDQSRQNVVG